jgi:hypothetical protein
MNNDTALILLLADMQRQVEALRAENTELRAEHNRGFAAGITAAAAELRQERDAIPHEADGSVAGVYDQAAKIVEALSS